MSRVDVVRTKMGETIIGGYGGKVDLPVTSRGTTGVVLELPMVATEVGGEYVLKKYAPGVDLPEITIDYLDIVVHCPENMVCCALVCEYRSRNPV